VLPLAKVATDPHVVIRNAAVQAMYRMVMGENIYYLGDKFPPVPDAAAEYLLRHMAMDSNPTWQDSVSSTAAGLLSGCSPKAIEPLIPNLIAIFSNPHRPDFLRWHAVSVLERNDLRHPQAVPAMVEFLKEDESVSTSNALVSWGDTDALVSMVPEIEKIALNDRLKTEPQFQALYVLAEVGRRLKTNQSFPIFVQALDVEKAGIIQGVALNVLGERRDDAILTPDDILALWGPLHALLKGDNPDSRDSAARWIAAIPPHLKPVMP
jgi:HEAT repeat protein